ncbi:MAG TPA: homoserine dehydrogenase [Dehalococcoidia bacterium]|nr:homoserine dehydrogenase [Dehalococcoidia bacterium]
MVARGSIGIGLMGLGVIGGGVARVLREKPDSLAREAGSQLVLKKILEKDTAKHGSMGIERHTFTTRFEELVSHPEIDVVVELIGGEYPAFEYIREALTRGKHVVTANKEVMSKHWNELVSVAQEYQVSLRCEASVGGGIPLIAPFQEDLVANDISAIYGILNGTTNYILTRMAKEGLDFSIALKKAQELGYAEADPSKDIEGVDAAYKLAILATIAFGTEVRPEDVYHEGISRLERRDFRYAGELGYAIKLLAIAKLSGDSIEARVHPVFIPEDSLLAKVDGVYNAIHVEGDLVGRVVFYGEGAGPRATSSAVISDIIKIVQDINRGVSSPPKLPFAAERNVRPVSEIESRYYMRMNVADRAGVLAQISKILGDNAISISSVIQKESNATQQTAEIVIMTHPAREEAVQKALKELEQLPVVKDISNFVRVEA